MSEIPAGKYLKSVLKAGPLSAPPTIPFMYQEGAGPLLHKCVPAIGLKGFVSKTCYNCGKGFQTPTKSKTVQTCSRECQWTLKRDEAIYLNSTPCEVCGVLTYRTPAHRARTSRTYCGAACMAVANTGAGNPAFNGGPVQKICLQCKKGFTVNPSTVDWRECCSRSCASLRKWAQSDKRLPEIPCAQCGLAFKKRWQGSAFCSKLCSAASHAANMAGPGNPRYVHGEANAPYPMGWNKAYKAKVRARDGHACMLCKKPDSETGTLDVHHIDYVKTNLSMSNLIALCRVCHGSLHPKCLKKREVFKTMLSSLLQKSASSP